MTTEDRYESIRGYHEALRLIRRGEPADEMRKVAESDSEPTAFTRGWLSACRDYRDGFIGTESQIDEMERSERELVAHFEAADLRRRSVYELSGRAWALFAVAMILGAFALGALLR